MTTEFILLLVAIILVAYGFAADVADTFVESGARLGARLEKQLTVGTRLQPNIDPVLNWEPPPQTGNPAQR